MEQRVEELELETELAQLMDQHEESSAGKKKRRRIRKCDLPVAIHHPGA